MAHTIDVPQQAQIDAESVKTLGEGLACGICNEKFHIAVSSYVLGLVICPTCFGIAQRLLRRVVRRELGLN
jgi:hypothetical protein